MDNSRTYLEAPVYNPSNPNYKDITVISPAVITSKPAENTISTIKNNVSSITNSIKNQSATVAATKAANEQQAAIAAQEKAKTDLEKEKLNVQKEANDLKKKVLYSSGGTKATGIDTNGNRYFTEDDLAKADKTGDSSMEILEAKRRQADAAYEREAKRVQKTIEDISNGVVPLTPAEQAQIDSMKAQFNALIEKQKLTNINETGNANIRGFQTGAGEYDPTFQNKTIGNIVTAGLNKVGELNVKMASAVAELEAGFRESKISNIQKAWKVYEDSVKERKATIQAMIDESNERIKEANEASAKQEEEYDKILLDIAKNNAPAEVVTAVQNAPTYAEKVIAAGDYLSTATGIIGEYNFYKRQAIASGQTPVDFNTYQNMDANRKIKIAAASSNAGSNLSSKETTIFNSLVDKYNNSPLVKAYDRTTILQGIIDSVKSNPGNSASQLSLAYGYIQALDTYQSAVREGELGLVNSIDSKAGQLKNWTEQIANGQIVRPEVALQIAKSAQQLVNTIKSGAENKQKTYSAQAKINGQNVGNAFNDYIYSVNSIQSTENNLLKSEDEAKAAVERLYDSYANEIDSIIRAEPNISYSEILQVLGQ